MNYFIYDQQGVKQAPLQNYTSILWKPKYYSSGTCEIYARPTDDNVKYLKKWNRIVCQERNEILFISSVKRVDDELVINGYMDNLDHRVNSSVSKIKNIETDLLNLITKNKRGLDINVGDPKGLAGSLVKQKETSFDTLRKTFEDLCPQFNFGWREVVVNNTLNCFELYQGELKQRARFSDEIGNLISQKYIEDVSEFANYAFVLGEGEGADRKMVTIDDRKEPEPLIETYIDARDIQSTYKGVDGAEHKYSDSEYKQMLEERGRKKLKEIRDKSFVYEFELNPNNEIAKLGSDYDLGDVVPVISRKFNLFIHTRIIGIDFIEEKNQSTKIKLIVKIENMKGARL